MTILFRADDQIDGIELSNSNAAAVLRVLALPVVADGEASGAEFRERVTLALATDAQEATPDQQTGRWTDCGRSSTYMQDRLAQLADLARRAERIHWS